MKLLILTQKVDINDDLLGAFYRWFEEIAQHCEKIIITCLYQGEHHLPKNVKVLSLGKDNASIAKSMRILRKFLYLVRFYKYIWQERKNYDHVFVHMNQIYIVLGGLFWKLRGKKIGLWYAHGHVPLSLRIAEKFSDFIFTSAKSAFRLKSTKINVVGQGIDTKNFSAKGGQKLGDKFRIISVGRISPAKDYETLIKAIKILTDDNIKLEVVIVGGTALNQDNQYLENLKKLIEETGLKEAVKFIGRIPNKDLPEHLQSADLFVNMGQTGGVDKAVLEAMSCGLVVLTCNEPLSEILENYKNKLMYERGDFKTLAEKIKFILNLDDKEREKIGLDLREIVVKNHSLKELVKKILKIYE